jgi:hypothetical protein
LSDIVSSISFVQFPFRLQPIFEVVAKQSAVRAVDLVRAIQQFRDPRGAADRICVTGCGLQFKLPQNFIS